MSDRTLFSRRQILSLFGGATGAAIVGVNGQTSNTANGNLTAGTDNMPAPYQVGEATYKGPQSVRSEVPQEDGTTFIVTDAGSNNDQFAIEHYNSGWARQGMNTTSLDTDEQSIRGRLDTAPDASGYIICTGGKSIYAESRINYDNIAMVYDIAKDEWQALSPMNYDRTDHVAVYYEGGIWVFGSDSGTGDTVERYDIDTDTWTEKPSLNVPRKTRLSTNGVVIDGKVYICGGGEVGATENRLTAVEEYDLDNETVTQVSDMPQNQSFPMQAKYNGYLYLLTGNQNNGAGGNVQRYDPSTDTWLGPSNFQQHPEYATDGAGVQIGDEFHFLGGWNTEISNGQIDSHYKYSMPDDEWTEVRELPGGSHSHGKAEFDGQYLYRLMGRTKATFKDSFTNTVWRWHKDSGLEAYGQTAPFPKYNFVATYTTDTPYGRT